jgi:hypothetical protein
MESTVNSTASADILQRHHHSPQEIYGLTANTMARKALTPIVITAGNAAWGTELQIHNGTVIASGDATKLFDLNMAYITAVDTPVRITILEWYYGSTGTPVDTVVITDATDLFTKIGHGLSNGDQVMVSNIVTTTGINTYTAYYVVGVAGTSFQLSLTLGGAEAVVVGGGNGTCSVAKITKTLLTEHLATLAATDGDANPLEIRAPRVPANSKLWCRGISAGGTNVVSFFHGVHIY